MSTDSGDAIVSGNDLHDTTIITVNGSSVEGSVVSAGHGDNTESDEMVTDEVGNQPGSSGDLNTEDLAAFEAGMNGLQVGPDSDKNSPEQPRSSEQYVGKQQLFETCCFIENQQRSNYPLSPPKSCLMDQHTVSMRIFYLK